MRWQGPSGNTEPAVTFDRQGGAGPPLPSPPPPPRPPTARTALVISPPPPPPPPLPQAIPHPPPKSAGAGQGRHPGACLIFGRGGAAPPVFQAAPNLGGPPPCRSNVTAGSVLPLW